MRIFCPAICRTLFLDVFPVSGRVPLIAALKERDIFITCASRYGLNPAMPGSSPRSGTDPRTRACRLCADRLIPCVFESGHTWACFEQQTLLQRRLFSQIGRYRASGNTLSVEEHLNGTYRKPNKHSSPSHQTPGHQASSNTPHTGPSDFTQEICRNNTSLKTLK